LSYVQYGIKPQLVERVKFKMKNPAVKERIKAQLNGVKKAHLQDRPTVRRLIRSAAQILGEPLTDAEVENFASFVIAQKIDPNSTLHLLRLWGMFR